MGTELLWSRPSRGVFILCRRLVCYIGCRSIGKAPVSNPPRFGTRRARTRSGTSIAGLERDSACPPKCEHQSSLSDRFSFDRRTSILLLRLEPMLVSPLVRARKAYDELENIIAKKTD